jgi:SAM-dependent methyltransferase
MAATTGRLKMEFFKSVFRSIVHLILPIRSAQKKLVTHIARRTKGCKILEIGCGGEDTFSRIFEKDNTIILSDVNKYPNCETIDVTKMDIQEEYDLVIAMNVLEHVFDFRSAIRNIHRALKPDGKLILSVPFFYPLHDLPHDYWRFTKWSLIKELEYFRRVHVQHAGLKFAPHSVHAVAIK